MTPIGKEQLMMSSPKVRSGRYENGKHDSIRCTHRFGHVELSKATYEHFLRNANNRLC
jgi:hypothetical protein